MSVLGFDVDRCLLNSVWARSGASLSLDKDFFRRLFLNLSLVDEVEISSSPLGGIPQTSGSARELSVERWPLTLSGCASRHQEGDVNRASGRPTHRHDSTLDLTSFHVQASQIFGDPSSKIPTLLHRIMGSEDSPIVSYRVAQGIH